MHDTLARLLAGRGTTQQYSAPQVEDFPREVFGYERVVAEVGPIETTRDGLAAVDAWASATPTDDTATARAVGLFYGAVLLASLPHAHWKIGAKDDPVIRVLPGLGIAPLSVARRRLRTGSPTLVENYDKVMSRVQQG